MKKAWAQAQRLRKERMKEKGIVRISVFVPEKDKKTIQAMCNELTKEEIKRYEHLL